MPSDGCRQDGRWTAGTTAGRGGGAPAVVQVSDDGSWPGLADGWTREGTELLPLGTGSDPVKSVMSGPNGLGSNPSCASWGTPHPPWALLRGAPPGHPGFPQSPGLGTQPMLPRCLPLFRSEGLIPRLPGRVVRIEVANSLRSPADQGPCPLLFFSMDVHFSRPIPQSPRHSASVPAIPEP